MANLIKDKNEIVRKNLQNLSWFSTSLLLFQVFLILFGIFEFEHELIATFNRFLQDSSFFISIISCLLILSYWIKGGIPKRPHMGVKFRTINTSICAGNIVMVNQLYIDDNIEELIQSILEFPSWKIVLFTAIIIIGLYLVVRFGRRKTEVPPQVETQVKDSKKKTEVQGKAQPLDPEGVGTEEAKQPQRESPIVPQEGTGILGKVAYGVVFTILLGIIVGAVYLLIAKYDVISKIISDTEKGANIFVYLFVVVLFIVAIPTVAILLGAATRSICKSLTKLPDYAQGKDAPEERTVKIALGIVLIPVFIIVTKYFGLSTEWVLDLLQSQDFIVAPFIILLYLGLAMLFVEVFYGLFSGKPRKKWVQGFSEIASDTGDSIIRICKSLAKSFFRLIEFGPDILESIEELFMGEDDNTTKTKKEKTNPKDKDKGNSDRAEE